MLAAEGLSALAGTAAEMSDEYSKATLDLSNRIEEWAALDPYDPKRPKLVQVHPAAHWDLCASMCLR